MSNLRLILALGLLATSIDATGEVRQPGTAKLLNNQEGVVVVIIPMTDNPSEAIVRVSGTGTLLDGQVQVLSLVANGSTVDYTTWNGSIVLQNSGSSQWKTIKVLIPGRRSPTAVYYDQKASERVKIEPIVARAFNLRSSASQKSDFEAIDKKQQADALVAANKQCGTKMTASLSYGDSEISVRKVFDVGHVCAQHLTAIADLCEESIGKEAVQKQIKSVECRIGEGVKYSLRAGNLVIVSAADLHAPKARTYDWLENRL